MCDRTVRKVSAGRQRGKSCFDRRHVRGDVGDVEEPCDEATDFKRRFPTTTSQYPGEFAEYGHRYRDHCRLFEKPSGCLRLRLVILHGNPDEQVGVGRDVQSSPAQPFAMMSFISSMLITR